MIDLTGKLMMGALLAASIPLAGGSEMWAQWGLAGLVVGFTLWRDHQRERRMSQALESHQSWVRLTMLDALKRNTVALEKITRHWDET